MTTDPNPTTSTKFREAYRFTRIVWATVPLILPGLVVTLLAHFRAKSLGLPSRRYWVTFAASAVVMLSVYLLLALHITSRSAGLSVQTVQSQPGSSQPPDLAGSLPTVSPAEPPSDLTPLLEYGNAAAAAQDIFIPETVQPGRGGADPDPNGADLTYQLTEAAQTAGRSGNPEAYWAVIDPSSGFYGRYDTGHGAAVQFMVPGGLAGCGCTPQTTPGQPRTFRVEVVGPSDTLDDGPIWNLTFTPEGPQGQWMVTAMSLAATS